MKRCYAGLSWDGGAEGNGVLMTGSNNNVTVSFVSPRRHAKWRFVSSPWQEKRLHMHTRGVKNFAFNFRIFSYFCLSLFDFRL